jgi:hypothetical protein
MRERKRRWRWIIGLVVGAMMVGAYELPLRLLYEDSPRERADVGVVNPKLEFRNPKQIRNSKFEIPDPGCQKNGGFESQLARTDVRGYGVGSRRRESALEGIWKAG